MNLIHIQPKGNGDDRRADHSKVGWEPVLGYGANQTTWLLEVGIWTKDLFGCFLLGLFALFDLSVLLYKFVELAEDANVLGGSVHDDHEDEGESVEGALC